MKKKVIISVIAALIIAAAGIFAVGGVQKANEKPVSEQTVSETEKEENPAEESKEEKTEEKAEEKTQAQAEEKAETKEEPKTEAAPEEKKEEKVYTPTFMYFISASDPDFEKENAVVEELKKEYEGKVTFDVRNIDTDEESKKNFPVDGNTPMLIMLNTKNDISSFMPKCSDKDALKAEIEKAFE